jgi:DNA-directed RNA polymerase specialized sigma24 family protein
MLQAGSVLAEGTEADFERFFTVVQPKLCRALVARYGPDRGKEATAEALAWAWEHWERVALLDNQLGYLYRVGQSKNRKRRQRPVFEVPGETDPVVEPGLARALAALPDRQRVATLLVYGAGWTQAEVARLLGVQPSTVHRNASRGLGALRKAIGGGGR